MKACTIYSAHRLSLDDVPIPSPGNGEVLLKLLAGGICGSDLHYFHDGGVGDFKLREPMVLGHEVAAEIVGLGPATSRLCVGDRVAVNPARPCGVCPTCLGGRSNLCPEVRFFGSAARLPHVQGAFAEYFLARQEQCFPISASTRPEIAASAEPLAVALHAIFRATRAGGPLVGKRVLITGAGPIGLFLVLAARLAGALAITVTDLFDHPLEVARAIGALSIINSRTNPSGLADDVAHSGAFDVALEASGSYAALIECVNATRAGGCVVTVGLPSPAAAPSLRINSAITREIDLIGSFRFHDEFPIAVAILEAGKVDARPLLSAQLPLTEVHDAFQLASDRTRAIKVSLIQ